MSLVTRGLGSIGTVDGELLVSMGFGGPGTVPGPGGAFQGLLLVSTFLNLELQLTEAPTIAGPAADPSQYLLVPTDGGAPATVTAVSISGNDLELTTTEHTTGKHYQLTVPTIGLVSVTNKTYQGPFLFSYVGVGHGPIPLLARSIDARTMEIVFNEALDEASAMNPANYSVAPPLAIISVVKTGLDTVYRLTTGRQDRGTLYTVTLTNVKNPQGNPL